MKSHPNSGRHREAGESPTRRSTLVGYGITAKTKVDCFVAGAQVGNHGRGKGNWNLRYEIGETESMTPR